ncbi:hypothetical protein NLX67_14375 [Domibacillus sp. A3M-37]|uniref:PepSY domain-containing protein n=1 Tax=Domibacillus sp. A3M-37 TaxID=2962037 RepID=UPI0020B7BEEF|nr:hypothetical protein [Domibacillus sp. A3M-37]MCP3763562.1 hypothetical protein [Domibacillus sp. A3M-37]
MKMKLFLTAFIFIGLVVVLYKGYIVERPAAVSEAEAESLAVSTYDGEVQSIEWNKDRQAYEIVLENDKGTYALSVDGQSKKVSNVKLLEKSQTTLTLEEAREQIRGDSNGIVTSISDITGDGEPRAEAIVDKNGTNYRFVFNLETGETVSSDEIKVADAMTVPQEAKPFVVSELTAKEAAAREVDGNVTRIETVETNSGDHYKVTVENDDGGAHVYVQAATAKVSSISRFNHVKKEAPVEPESKPVNAPSAPAAAPKAEPDPEPAPVSKPSAPVQDDEDDQDDGDDAQDDDDD